MNERQDSLCEYSKPRRFSWDSAEGISLIRSTQGAGRQRTAPAENCYEWTEALGEDWSVPSQVSLLEDHIPLDPTKDLLLLNSGTCPTHPPNPHNTYLMLSVWVLYSIMVLGGRLSTRRSVSRMRAVVAWSLAVLFHMEIMSSYRRDDRRIHQRKLEAVRRAEVTHVKADLPARQLTWKRTETTAPQISSPTINCSPSIAKMRFSQQRDAKPFRSRIIHFPPFLFASSCKKKVLKVKISSHSIRAKDSWPLRSLAIFQLFNSTGKCGRTTGRRNEKKETQGGDPCNQPLKKNSQTDPLKIILFWELPGGPVAKAQHFQC